MIHITTLNILHKIAASIDNYTLHLIAAYLLYVTDK